MDIGKIISHILSGILGNGGDNINKKMNQTINRLVESNYRLTNMSYTFSNTYQAQINELIKNQNQLIEEIKQIKKFLKEKFPDD